MVRPARPRPAQAAIALLYLGAVVLFIASLTPYHRRNTGFTPLIAFGDQFQERIMPELRSVPHFTQMHSPGYDGQFYAQLALDPLLRDRNLDLALDAAPYRSRRILFAWTAYLFGLGQPRWIIQAYAIQNIVVWFLLAALLLRWLPPTSLRHFIAWFACLFGGGLMDSVRMALLEGPSMLVLMLAVLAVERNRAWLGAGLMAVGGLGRETNLIGSSVLIRRFPRTLREWASVAAIALLTVAPFLLWVLYVRSVYGPANYAGTDNVSAPFVAFAAEWKTTLAGLAESGWSSLFRYRFAVVASLTVQALFMALRREWSSAWWRTGAAYAAFLPMVGAAVWAGFPGAAVRVLLPMTFAFNILVVRSRWFWPLAFLGNLSVLYGLQKIDVPWLGHYL